MNNTEQELQAAIDRLSCALELMRTSGERGSVSHVLYDRLIILAEQLRANRSSMAGPPKVEPINTVETQNAGEED